MQQGCKLEVESVLREVSLNTVLIRHRLHTQHSQQVCERVLYDEKQKKEVLDKRAAALGAF